MTRPISTHSTLKLNEREKSRWGDECRCAHGEDQLRIGFGIVRIDLVIGRECDFDSGFLALHPASPLFGVRPSGAKGALALTALTKCEDIGLAGIGQRLRLLPVGRKIQVARVPHGELRAQVFPKPG